MLLVLAAAMLVVADPPVASTAAPATPAPAAAKPVKERRICRTLDDSSSRMDRRVCKTEREWTGGSSELPDTIAGAGANQPR